MAKTLHLLLDCRDLESALSRESLQIAAETIRSGGLVAFPTETVYGLGANALDPAAIARIFEAKRRPRWDPLIVHISDAAMLGKIARDIPPYAHSLMQRFWPGPLTLLLPKRESISPAVTAGRPRVGVRMPSHPVALELIRRAGVPIAAPSANLFGHVSPTSAAHVMEDLESRIDAVLDGGETLHGLESTVVDPCESPVVIYRPGVVTLEQIALVCPGATLYSEQTRSGSDVSTAEELAGSPSSAESPVLSHVDVIGTSALPSPGLAMRHYAPRARLVLVDGEGEAQHAAFNAALVRAQQLGGDIGLMLPDSFIPATPWGGSAANLHTYNWGRWADPDELAHRLFAGLRYLDATGAAVIVCPLPSGSGVGAAIRDRLLKAARQK
ncbi:MAG TPA: L-threonylcarbamoyladenylate synthase [Acidisarcina sp.]